MATTLPCVGEEHPPNVVYILADDLGYGDLGCYGHPLHRTPHIDALAKSGIRLTDFHAASWCAPSRRALLTGCHPHRPWQDGERRWGKLADAVTLAELLKHHGYATGLIGKWHLEMGPGLHPLDQGFETWFGTRGSNDWDGPRPNFAAFREAPEEAWQTPIYVDRENRGPIVSQSQFTQRYTAEATRWIEQHTDQPFFLYLAHNMPHVPIFASDSFRGQSANGVYGDVVEELDWSVGQIVKKLNELGLQQKTIVVFTSDNGPWTMFHPYGGTAEPLRGEKSTTWEGGERVPCIISWPGSLPEKVSPELVTNYDMYATVAQFCGAAIPAGQAIDSMDMSAMLREGKPSPRTRHVYYFSQAMAYRRGPYKLHRWTRERTRNPETGAREASQEHRPPLLFNVVDDVAESYNLAADNPDLVRELEAEMDQAQQAIAAWKPFHFKSRSISQPATEAR